ncbi:hypothetical protein RvY_10679 [Ramazzottius varieornatus]|uniref:Uncharacterized protein n=1 Tax=Ramazzottius varieornatus TaxID=947166 RepID=A0A1D1VDI8_RAMVA|nr:hypothetical protein RvY_10679 [Ramazzottius varieornatus]
MDGCQKRMAAVQPTTQHHQMLWNVKKYGASLPLHFTTPAQSTPTENSHELLYNVQGQKYFMQQLASFWNEGALKDALGGCNCL